MLPRISLIEGEKSKFLCFSTGDAISKSIFEYGLWEDHIATISKVFYDSLESPLVLDIGANLGAYSVPIAMDIKKKGGKVIAFEPQRIIFYQLCANTFINRLDNLFPYCFAVDECSGFVDMPEFDYSKNPNNMAFSLDKNARSFHGLDNSELPHSFKVQSVSLDDFIVDKPPALIKIDVEGYELRVLKGAVNFLRIHRFPPILFECWDFDWFSDQKNQLLNYVESIGYSYFKIDATNYIAQHPNNSLQYKFTHLNGFVNIEKAY